jgi:hypothetical protein
MRCHPVSQFGRHSFDGNPPTDSGAALSWAAKRSIGLHVKSRARAYANRPDAVGHVYYKNVLETTSDPEIKALAKEFVEEESGHVAELSKWIAAHKAGQSLLVD